MLKDSRRRRPTAAAAVLASAALLVAGGCGSTRGGLSHGKEARFAARHEIVVDVPEGARQVRAWLAVPCPDDPDQEVSGWRVESPYPTRRVHDTRGNEFLLLEANAPPAGPLTVVTHFTVVRHEVNAVTDPAATRPHTDAELRELAADLRPSSQSVIDDDVRRMAREVVGDERNPIAASRRIYDAVLARVEYHVKDPKPDAEKTMQASGTGSSRYTYEKCTGNCTDFHSLYAAVSRAAGIPTRAVYGSFFKGPLDGVDEDQSYHCWIEFHAPGVGWIPLDVAVADIFVDDFHANENSRPRADLTVADGYHGPDPALVDYYFGNLDRRRVVWHRGRDLVMVDPRQKGGPLLWNPKAYAEVDGAAAKVGRKLTFTEVSSAR